jgi:hypothetical protein
MKMFIYTLERKNKQTKTEIKIGGEKNQFKKVKREKEEKKVESK